MLLVYRVVTHSRYLVKIMSNTSVIRAVIGKYVEIKGDKVCCPFHGENTPSLHIYDETESFYCFGCSESGDAIKFVSECESVDYKEAKQIVASICEDSGIDFKELSLKKQKGNKMSNTSTILPEISKEERQSVIDTTTQDSTDSRTGLPYRGIREETAKKFGHRYKKDNRGNVIATYYPETNSQGKLTGYKCRNHPKDFSYGKVGATGSSNQLSGQRVYKGGGKYVLIVGGEHDLAAAYQMFQDHNKANASEYDAIHVVSPTSGENSCAKQCQQQYQFLNQYDFIVIGLDNDDAGYKAALETAEVLPKEKVLIASWSRKDPNQMLLEGKSKQFIRDFYSAKPLIKTGVKDSSTLIEAILGEVEQESISLPPCMHRLQALMTGGKGIPQGRIVNIIGDTSVGKSTIVNTMVHHWIFNAPEKVCVVSLEATEGQYALDIASLHLKKNLSWLAHQTNEYGDNCLKQYMNRSDVKESLDNLMYRNDGSARYHIIDERDGSIEALEKQMERQYRQFGCKIFVIDVLTDLLRGSSEGKQEDHMRWQKSFVKNGVTLINVLHTRKPSQADGKTRKVTEYDALGSGSFVQSAAINIVINRDKLAEGDEKNITHIDLPKCRGGKTGSDVCALYYEFETRQIVDYQDKISGKNHDAFIESIPTKNTTVVHEQSASSQTVSEALEAVDVPTIEHIDVSDVIDNGDTEYGGGSESDEYGDLMDFNFHSGSDFNDEHLYTGIHPYGISGLDEEYLCEMKKELDECDGGEHNDDSEQQKESKKEAPLLVDEDGNDMSWAIPS